LSQSLIFLLASVASAQTRDPYKQPFSSSSIWNLPIGTGAQYVKATIKQSTQYGMTVDPDIIVLKPTQPVTPIVYNGDGWDGGSRCDKQGNTLFSAPWPTNFIVPGASGTDTPNYSGAILGADNVTIYQAQPMAHCTSTGPVTALVQYPSVKINGDGIQGAHGGSGLSSIGGTIRLGELAPNAPSIRHAFKVNLYAKENYYHIAPYYRWPAVQADGYASGNYGGTNPAVQPGSLLALDTTLDISNMGFETTPGKMLAWTFQNYGAYIVDDTAWDVYAIETEQSPDGDVVSEFQKNWGFTIDPSSKNTPWGRDMDRIFTNLSVVNNWNQNLYNQVVSSNGTLGAGGGKPLQPWAPPLQ